MKSYKEFFTKLNTLDPKKYYVIVTECSEERGGSSKPSSIVMCDDLPSAAFVLAHEDGGSILELKNGAAFFKQEQEESKEGKTEVILDKELELGSWWAAVGRPVDEDVGDEVDEEEEEDDDVIREDKTPITKRPKDGYVLLQIHSDHKTNVVRKRDIWYFPRFAPAIKAYFGFRDETDGCLELFRLIDGEPKLLISDAPNQPDEQNTKTTGFSQYDYAYNPYQACGFACVYCYASQYKDFRNLPLDLKKRVVIGSHTDPYQDLELEQKKTQNTLLILKDNKEVTKVGIFTKSPLVIRDLDLLAVLPNPVIHLNLSPFSDEWQKKLEPGAPANNLRLEAARKIKHDGRVKLVINICPCIPGLSDDVIGTPEMLEAYGLADEICVGLTCLYGTIPQDLAMVLPVGTIDMMTKGDWDLKFCELAQTVFAPFMKEKLVIWRDASRRGWKNMLDLSVVSQEWYNN